MTDTHYMVEKRRKLLTQTRQRLEADRCGPDLTAHCGCTFIPWRHRHEVLGNTSGIGLTRECDMAQRLFEQAIQPPYSVGPWEAHVTFAREDAENKLQEIVNLLIFQKALRPFNGHLGHSL